MARISAAPTLAVTLLAAAAALGQPHLPAGRLDVAGVPNLGRVHAGLLRGGQPSADGIRALAALGVRLVIDLRGGEERSVAEREVVEGLGIAYVAIPMSGWRTPRPEEVERFLRLLSEERGGAVFVHCRRGAERTGVMIASYRMAVQGWTPAEARAEMEAYDFRAWLHPHLVRWVNEFEPEPVPAPTPALASARP